MRTALISSGPSLRTTYTPDQRTHDLVIGVNAAATIFPVHWWSVGDWETFYPGTEELIPIGSPNVSTMHSSMSELLRRGKPDWMTGEVRSWKQLCVSTIDNPQGWATWSSTAAIVLAVTLGATSLDVYGVDMAGELDCRLIKGGGRSEAGRWVRERPAWARAVEWARSHGLPIQMHRPAEVMA